MGKFPISPPPLRFRFADAVRGFFECLHGVLDRSSTGESSGIVGNCVDMNLNRGVKINEHPRRTYVEEDTVMLGLITCQGNELSSENLCAKI